MALSRFAEFRTALYPKAASEGNTVVRHQSVTDRSPKPVRGEPFDMLRTGLSNHERRFTLRQAQGERSCPWDTLSDRPLAIHSEGSGCATAPSRRKYHTCANPPKDVLPCRHHDDLSLEAYGYELPPELIAQRPIEPRDSSRLMVVHREARRFEHRVFIDLLEYLRPGDVMVFNDSRVFPARMYGVRVDTGAKIELLLLRRQSPGVWHTLARPGRRMTPGTTFELRGGTVAIEGEVLEAHDDGSRTVRLSDEDRLDEIGVVPLPPYIQEPLEDPERYQTVYSRERGSVAAPTAGLHVTQRLMERIRLHGVETAFRHAARWMGHVSPRAGQGTSRATTCTLSSTASVR